MRRGGDANGDDVLYTPHTKHRHAGAHHTRTKDRAVSHLDADLLRLEAELASWGGNAAKGANTSYLGSQLNLKFC